MPSVQSSDLLYGRVEKHTVSVPVLSEKQLVARSMIRK